MQQKIYTALIKQKTTKFLLKRADLDICRTPMDSGGRPYKMEFMKNEMVEDD